MNDKKKTDVQVNLNVQKLVEDSLRLAGLGEHRSVQSNSTTTIRNVTTIVNGKVVESTEESTAASESFSGNFDDVFAKKIKNLKAPAKVELTCKGCGAKNIIDSGSDSLCEYCGSLLSE